MYDKQFIQSLLIQNNLINWLLDEKRVDWFYNHVMDTLEEFKTKMCEQLNVKELKNLLYHFKIESMDSESILLVMYLMSDEIPNGISGEKRFKLN